MAKRKGRGSARERLQQMLKDTGARHAAEQAARAEKLIEKGKRLWPMFMGTENERSIACFYEHWTPERVLDVWHAEFRAYGLDASTVVHRITVSLKGRSVRAGGHPPSGAAWWPRFKFVRLRTSLLQWLDQNPDVLFVPDAVIRPGMVSERSGLATTVASLAEVAGDPHRVGAVLIGGSLFSRVVSSRRFRDWKLEPWVGLLLYNWMLKLAKPEWHPASGATLPLSHDGFGAKLDDMDQLIGVLALEHARVLHAYVPVCVRFVDEQPLPPLRLMR